MEPYLKEQQFILGCLSAVVRQDDGSVLDADACRGLNWEYVLDAGRPQRVLGFVTSVLQKGKLLPQLSVDVQQRLEASRSRATQIQRQRESDLRYVSGVLNNAHVETIPLKGVALAHVLYGSLPFREMFDIDLLVRSSDLRVAFDALCEAGFRREDITPSRNRWHADILRETLTPVEWIPLGRVPMGRGELHLDLHFDPQYRLGDRYVGLDVAALWSRSRPASGIGANVRLLSPRDHLMFSLLHASELYSPRLIQLLDMALLARHVDGEPLTHEVYERLSPRSRSHLETLYAASVGLGANAAGAIGTSTSGEIYQRFFARRAVPPVAPAGANAPDRPLSGAVVWRSLRSFRQRARFLAGYLLPGREYYPKPNRPAAYLTHWSALASKAWHSITSGVLH